ncbi:excisionase family DNA-binding protein [Ruminiclostridium herbifermentans]|uniref:Excisionase family DNA-binding protein n=1 Tax=Ruminiclostridium herbifermentans TaxID=2488810 RepID=A0A4U7JAU7_9FIRM|nr:excisionase family DNA-binding protein [Ruminiclostridium herbifermentans]QNU66941.1 excisionase family DNA-binding protein [Ruminiclostridium herbifermentans]
MQPATVNNYPVLWNAKTTAEYLGISYWSLTELARKKKIPFVPIGDRPHFRKEAIDQWVIEQEKASTKPETNRFGIQKIKE